MNDKVPWSWRLPLLDISCRIHAMRYAGRSAGSRHSSVHGAGPLSHRICLLNDSSSSSSSWSSSSSPSVAPSSLFVAVHTVVKVVKAISRQVAQVVAKSQTLTANWSLVFPVPICPPPTGLCMATTAQNWLNHSSGSHAASRSSCCRLLD